MGRERHNVIAFFPGAIPTQATPRRLCLPSTQQQRTSSDSIVLSGETLPPPIPDDRRPKTSAPVECVPRPGNNLPEIRCSAAAINSRRCCMNSVPPSIPVPPPLAPKICVTALVITLDCNLLLFAESIQYNPFANRTTPLSYRISSYLYPFDIIVNTAGVSSLLNNPYTPSDDQTSPQNATGTACYR